MVRLLRFRSLTSLDATASNLRRSYSEASLDNSLELPGPSSLHISHNRVTVGGKVALTWDLKENCNARDWIGLYYEDEQLVTNFLDSKTRGVGRNKQGSVQWHVSKDIAFREAVNACCFKYFDGLTGRVLAHSPTFSVLVPLSLVPQRSAATPLQGIDNQLIVTVSGLRANELKKGFFGRPNPYVKLTIVSAVRDANQDQDNKRHGKTATQSNSTDPVWQNEVFVMHATAADILEVEVRNRSGKFSKFLGKLFFPLRTIVDTWGYNKFRTITQPLVGRTPSDKVQGTFSLTVFVRKSNQAGDDRTLRTGDDTRRRSDASHRSLTNTSSVPLTSHIDVSTTDRSLGYSPGVPESPKRPFSCHQSSYFRREFSEDGTTRVAETRSLSSVPAFSQTNRHCRPENNGEPDTFLPSSSGSSQSDADVSYQMLTGEDTGNTSVLYEQLDDEDTIVEGRRAGLSNNSGSMLVLRSRSPSIEENENSCVEARSENSLLDNEESVLSEGEVRSPGELAEAPIDTLEEREGERSQSDVGLVQNPFSLGAISSETKNYPSNKVVASTTDSGECIENSTTQEKRSDSTAETPLLPSTENVISVHQERISEELSDSDVSSSLEEQDLNGYVEVEPEFLSSGLSGSDGSGDERSTREEICTETVASPVSCSMKNMVTESNNSTSLPPTNENFKVPNNIITTAQKDTECNTQKKQEIIIQNAVLQTRESEIPASLIKNGDPIPSATETTIKNESQLLNESAGSMFQISDSSVSKSGDQNELKTEVVAGAINNGLAGGSVLPLDNEILESREHNTQSDPCFSEPQSDLTSQAITNTTTADSENAIDPNKRTSIGTVLSFLDNITLQAESLLKRPGVESFKDNNLSPRNKDELHNGLREPLSATTKELNRQFDGTSGKCNNLEDKDSNVDLLFVKSIIHPDKTNESQTANSTTQSASGSVFSNCYSGKHREVLSNTASDNSLSKLKSRPQSVFIDGHHDDIRGRNRSRSLYKTLFGVDVDADKAYPAHLKRRSWAGMTSLLASIDFHLDNVEPVFHQKKPNTGRSSTRCNRVSKSPVVAPLKEGNFLDKNMQVKPDVGPVNPVTVVPDISLISEKNFVKEHDKEVHRIERKCRQRVHSDPENSRTGDQTHRTAGEITSVQDKNVLSCQTQNQSQNNSVVQNSVQPLSKPSANMKATSTTNSTSSIKDDTSSAVNALPILQKKRTRDFPLARSDHEKGTVQGSLEDKQRTSTKTEGVISKTTGTPHALSASVGVKHPSQGKGTKKPDVNAVLRDLLREREEIFVPESQFRETALLSSTAEKNVRESKNRPIGRTDMPLSKEAPSKTVSPRNKTDGASDDTRRELFPNSLSTVDVPDTTVTSGPQEELSSSRTIMNQAILNLLNSSRDATIESPCDPSHRTPDGISSASGYVQVTDQNTGNVRLNQAGCGITVDSAEICSSGRNAVDSANLVSARVFSNDITASAFHSPATVTQPAVRPKTGRDRIAHDSGSTPRSQIDAARNEPRRPQQYSQQDARFATQRQSDSSNRPADNSVRQSSSAERPRHLRGRRNDQGTDHSSQRQNGRPPEILRLGTGQRSPKDDGKHDKVTPHSVSGDDGNEPLPACWERAIDSHGRVYYIDHNTRTTTWNRPRRGGPSSPEHDVNTQLQQLDRRYQSLRRTIRGTKKPEPQANEQQQQSQGATAAPPASGRSDTDGPLSGSREPTIERRERQAVSITATPGCRFLRRRDFFQFVNNHGLANQFLHRNPALKHVINRVRADPAKYERYQHSRDLVTLLNFFANSTSEIPPGWERKRDQFGQTYFVDHNSRSTTFVDPRLPLDDNATSRPRSRTDPLSGNAFERLTGRRPQRPLPPLPGAVSGDSGMGSSVPSTYNERVVAFLRDSNIEDILRRKDKDFTSKGGLRRKIAAIQRNGVGSLERLSNDVELVILLSLFEDEIQAYIVPTSEDESDEEEQVTKDLAKVVGRLPAPYRRDFEAKLRTFHRQMVQGDYGQGPGKIRMKIRRKHVVEDAYEHIIRQSPRALQKDKLYIKFTGEEGLDYGGPAREFFFLLSRQLFNPYYGLFEYSASDTYTLQVSPVSIYVDNAQKWFRFCGRVIALALIHQHLLDVFFTRTIYKALLRQPYDLSDLESFDAEYHQSLTWMLENDITDVLDLYFTVNEDVFGQVNERELKPGGKSIPVTEENKLEYVDLMVRWRVERGVGEQMDQLVHGFNEALEHQMISIFDARELELVIAGTADIDVKDWRVHTEYRSGYHDRHQVIQWFWKAVDSFNNEQRLRLIQFVTGTSSIPFEGFSALRGSTGPRKFTIDCWGSNKMLPRAHTCFNRLDLPPYRNYEELYAKLSFAVEETSTFGIE